MSSDHSTGNGFERTFIQKYWPWLVLLGVAFAVYAKTFGFSWTYDDFIVIINNSDIRSWPQFLANNYPGRPLRELTYLFDYSLFGLEPSGWRIQHLCWHVFCGGLLYELCRQLTGQKLVAATAALIFLVHPLQVEVVANLAHRKDMLVLAFCLLALLFWICSYETSRPVWWRLGALLAWGVALLAKENAIGLPLLWLLYEWQFVAVEKRFLLRFPRPGISYPTLAVAAGLIWCWRQGGIANYRDYSRFLLEKLEYFGAADLGIYLRTVFKSWSFMLSRLVWPAELAIEYKYPVPGSWGDPWVLGTLLIAVGMIVLMIWALRKQEPVTVFLCGWLMVFWLPTSNLWPLAYFAADRYLYPFVAGAAALFSWWFYRWLGRPAQVAALGVLVCLPMSIVSWHQTGYWRNEEVLYRHALVVSPGSSFLNNELGKLAEARGDLSAATNYYRSALEKNPHNAAAHYNLGQLYERDGQLPHAIEHYRYFLEDDTPAYKEAARELDERLRRRYGIMLKIAPKS